MNGARTIVTLTALTAFLSGCAGHVVDWDSLDKTPLPSCTESESGTAQKRLPEEETPEVAKQSVPETTTELKLSPLETDRSEKRAIEDLQGALAQVETELETLRLPCREQMAVVKSLAGLPTPSEIASLPSPGPLEGEAYESLVRAAEAYRACASVHANNLANTETTGFKRSWPNFEDLFYRHEMMSGAIDAAGSCTATGTSVGPGTRVSSIQVEQRQGAFKQTNRDLDVLIEGRGFFQVLEPSGGEILYTRAGNFSKNVNNELVMGSANTGRLLEPSICIPEDAIHITVSPLGEVFYKQPGLAALTSAGNIELARFANSEGLLRIGGNLFSETDASGPPITGRPGKTGFGHVRQGCLEASNVEPLAELAALTRCLRMLRVVRWLLLAGGPEPDLDTYYSAPRRRATEESRPVSGT